MDLRQLRYFVTVVEEGTISAAARRLNISQPPLSLQIRMLEDEYGLKLFERGARRITLTDAGRMFYRYATGILELEHAADTDMRNLKAGKRGSVRIGVVSSFYSAKVYAALKSFRRKYPKVQFQVFEGNTYQLIEHLHNGRIELAVIRTPYQDRELDEIVLEEDQIIAAGPIELMGQLGHSEASSEENVLHFRDLKDSPLILYRRWEKILSSGFARERIDPDILCIADDARTSLQWASEGLGIALAPRSAMHQAPQLSYARVAEEGMVTNLCLVHRRDAVLSQSAELFLKEAARTVSEPEPYRADSRK